MLRIRRRRGASTANHLGLEEADDRLRERVVVGVADRADGALDTGLGEPISVADREVLHPAIAVMNQLVAARAGVQRLLEGVEGNVALSEFATRQPTIAREKTSMTKAT